MRDPIRHTRGLAVFVLLVATSSSAQATDPSGRSVVYAQATRLDEGPARPTEAEPAYSLASAPKPKLHRGQRVRLWTDQKSVDGLVLAADADHVLLHDPSRSTSPYGSASIQWSSIQSAEIRTSGAGWGAIVGAVVFGALGAAAGGIASSAGLSSGSSDPGAIAGGAAGGALIGAGLGAAVGSAFKRWKQVYPAR